MSAPAAAAPAPQEVRRIGCLMLNGVGDILCASPALEALRDRYPTAHLTVMVRPHLRGLVEANPAVDEVLAFGSGSLGRRLAFLRELRRRRFDLWVDLHTPTFNTVTGNTRHFVRNAFLMRWSGARFRRAYASRPLAGHLTHPLPCPDDAQLSALNVVDLTLALAWPRTDREYRKRLGITPGDRRWALEALPEGPRRIGLYFGSRQPAKLWPAASMVRLTRMILERLPDVALLLIGDATDAARAESLVAALDPAQRARVRDFTGRATFGQTASLIERCAAVVSSDSGPMHMVDAMDVPMVALFSSHNYPAVWRPVNGRSTVIFHEIECGPCMLAECPIGNRCMANITPEEVFAALVQRLGG